MTKFTKISAAALVAAIAFSPSAMAQTGQWYGDVGLANISGESVDVQAIQGRLGYEFNDNFGIEGEVALGISEETDDGVDYKLNHEAGVYGVLSTANREGFEFFGRLGFATAETEASDSSETVETSQDGLAYGVGAKYYFDDLNGIRVDFTKYDFDDDAEADVFSVAYTRKF